MLIEKPRIPLREVLIFGLWPSLIKLWLYRLKGYRIGKGVSIGFGSIISAKRVEIGDGTSIGFLTIIRGKEIRLGSFVQIGSTTFIDTPYVDIGDGSKINEQVFVGGLQYPDSRFVLGRNCQVMQMSFINPAKSVVVGDDSGIGGHSLIFGHTSWLSQFEGYGVDFAPVEIGNSVCIAWRVFILPRTKIGDGTVIGANSMVQGTIPPRCMAVGFPARIVSREPDFPKPLSDSDKEVIFNNIIADMISYFAACELTCRQSGELLEVGRIQRTWWGGTISSSWTLLSTNKEPRQALRDICLSTLRVFVSLHEISSDLRRTMEDSKTMWFDVARKEQSWHSNDLGDEVSLFFRRYGVRALRIRPGSQPS